MNFTDDMTSRLAAKAKAWVARNDKAVVNFPGGPRPRTYVVVTDADPSQPPTKVVSFIRSYKPKWTPPLALNALRRAHAAPQFIRPNDVSFMLTHDEHHRLSLAVDGREAPHISDWLRRSEFREALDALDASEARCDLENERLAQIAARHPANLHALAETRRAEAIKTALPTETVDAWIIANMGYTAETLAALGKATRRDRRQEARRQMMRAAKS